MPKVPAYQAARIDEATAALRARGVDPALVSVACAIGEHQDCDGTVDTLRDPGEPAPRCRCPVKTAKHPKGH